MKLLLLALSLCIFPVNATTEINDKYLNSSEQKGYQLGWQIGFSMGEINVICSDRQYDRYPARGGQMLIEPSYKRLVEKLSPSQLQTERKTWPVHREKAPNVRMLPNKWAIAIPGRT